MNMKTTSEKASPRRPCRHDKCCFPLHTPISSLKIPATITFKGFSSFISHIRCSFTFHNLEQLPKKEQTKLKIHCREVEFYINHGKMIDFSIFLGGFLKKTIQEVQWPTANCAFIHFLHHLASGLAPKARKVKNLPIPTSYPLVLSK